MYIRFICDWPFTFVAISKTDCNVRVLLQSVYNLLGETLSRLQQFEEAERWYQAALQVQPDHVPAHITYGKLLAKNVSTLLHLPLIGTSHNTFSVFPCIYKERTVKLSLSQYNITLSISV